MGLMPLCDEQPERETSFLSEVLLSGLKLHKELCSSRVWILIPVTGFLVVAYPASFLPLDTVCLSSVSHSCACPFSRPCLPLCDSFPFATYRFAVRGVAARPIPALAIFMVPKPNHVLYRTVRNITLKEPRTISQFPSQNASSRLPHSLEIYSSLCLLYIYICYGAPLIR